jgi:deazaflavin-dependent oxidoreductase (nitroreductase family)
VPIDAPYARGSWDMAADHAELYESSGGTKGATIRGVRCVMLTTLGRRSGKARRSVVMRVEHEGTYAAIASMGGQPQHPNWYLNVCDHPTVTLRDATEVADYSARTAEGEERAEWWKRATDVWPAYDEYQAKTTRVIPVVILEPVD